LVLFTASIVKPSPAICQQRKQIANMAEYGELPGRAP
jgi:hypothetical protein